MIGMKIGWLILQVILLGFFIWFGSGTAFVISIVLLLIPLCSFFLHLYIRKHLEVRLTADVNMNKGKSGIFSVHMDNPTIFPVFRIGYKIQVENQLNREKRTIRMTGSLSPKKQIQTSMMTGSDYCGRLRVSIQKIVLYDIFGLFGVPCKCQAVTHMTVQPDTFETSVTVLQSFNSVEESEVYSQDRPGSDLTETFQIREYVPGDSPRQIHWKLSSKFDKLIVRDPALPITRNVLIFWERTGESGSPDLLDAQAEIVVSLGKSLIEQSIQFSIAWNDTDRNLCIRYEIQDMDELVGVIPRLMRASGVKEGVSGAALLMQDGSDALCAHMIYIAEEPQKEVMDMQRFGHVSMLLCGKTSMPGAVMFDAQNYQEQLMQIEL